MRLTSSLASPSSRSSTIVVGEGVAAASDSRRRRHRCRPLPESGGGALGVDARGVRGVARGQRRPGIREWSALAPRISTDISPGFTSPTLRSRVPARSDAMPRGISSCSSIGPFSIARLMRSIRPAGRASWPTRLYADLYGIAGAGTAAERRSLFRYFHGRSSLATWLRAVLAQRHVDALRARRRIESLPEEEDAIPAVAAAEPDPDRASLGRLIEAALADRDRSAASEGSAAPSQLLCGRDDARADRADHG